MSPEEGPYNLSWKLFIDRKLSSCDFLKAIVALQRLVEYLIKTTLDNRCFIVTQIKLSFSMHIFSNNTGMESENFYTDRLVNRFNDYCRSSSLHEKTSTAKFNFNLILAIVI